MAVKFKGPLFDDPGAAIRKGARPGLARFGAQIEATVLLNTPRRSGEAKRNVKTIIWRDQNGVSVKSSLANRKTWLEAGTRRPYGKIGTAHGMWRKGRAKARQLNKQALMAADIARQL